jgi:hypothetical protein
MDQAGRQKPAATDLAFSRMVPSGLVLGPALALLAACCFSGEAEAEGGGEGAVVFTSP